MGIQGPSSKWNGQQVQSRNIGNIFVSPGQTCSTFFKKHCSQITKLDMEESYDLLMTDREIMEDLMWKHFIVP